jgi:hypothetical protein
MPTTLFSFSFSLFLPKNKTFVKKNTCHNVSPTESVEDLIKNRNILLTCHCQISVITGAFANDFTASSVWDKVVNCFNTLKEQYFVRGWKRCWEYAKLGEQKWRNSLKPHMIVEILRLSAKKLKQVDLRHYNAASQLGCVRLQSVMFGIGQMCLQNYEFILSGLNPNKVGKTIGLFNIYS